MNKKKLSHSSLNSSITSVLAALLCILIGLVVGFLVLLAINPAHAWGDGFVRILKGGFHDAPYGVGKELANAAPLIMTGLSVAFAFKTGLFNIGAAGQYTLGAYGALYCAIMLKLPWFVCLIAATILGGIWGAIPGFFKAYFNINEVITSIMFNWIGLYLVNELIYQNGTGPMYDVRNTRTINISKNADYAQSIIPDFGGTQRLARLVGMGMAKQLVYSALNIKADEALRIGLVNAVYPQAELMENVLKLAGKIAKNAPIAVRNCKKAINGGISLPIEKAVEVEEKLFGSCFETHDQKEGMACFLSREKPKPKAVFTNN